MLVADCWRLLCSLRVMLWVEWVRAGGGWRVENATIYSCHDFLVILAMPTTSPFRLMQRSSFARMQKTEPDFLNFLTEFSLQKKLRS